MTVNDVISEVRSLNRGEYKDDQLRAWIRRLEARIYTEIISTHEGGKAENLSDDERELYAPEPHADLYRHYIDAMIYLSNGESGRAETSSSLFNSAYSDFARYYHNTRLPCSGEKIKF